MNVKEFKIGNTYQPTDGSGDFALVQWEDLRAWSDAAKKYHASGVLDLEKIKNEFYECCRLYNLNLNISEKDMLLFFFKKYFQQDPTPFFDMHGNKVIAGDKIKIIHHYNYQHLHGIEAEVVWNKDKGLYEFKYVEVRRNQEFPSSENFYGVHEFELIK